MPIDFKNLTQEDKESLKRALPDLDLGLVVLDPSKPIDRPVAEKLNMTIKVAGEDKTVTIWDAGQGFTKAEGADAKLRDAADQVKQAKQMVQAAATSVEVVQAFGRINQAQKEGKVGEKKDFELVAPVIGEEPETLMSAYQEAVQQADTKPGDKNQPAPRQGKIKLEDLDPALVAMLPNQVEKGWMQEGVNKSGLSFIETLVTKTIDKNPKITKLTSDVGNDPNKKAILDTYVKAARGTLDARLKGRIQQLVQSGRTDVDDAALEAEAAKLADQTMAELDVETILAKAAPPNIILGSGVPGEGSLKIVSGKPVEKVAMDDPRYTDRVTEEIMQGLASKVPVTT